MKALSRNRSERSKERGRHVGVRWPAPASNGRLAHPMTSLVKFSEPLRGRLGAGPRPTWNIRRRRTIDARTLQTVRVRVKSKPTASSARRVAARHRPSATTTQSV